MAVVIATLYDIGWKPLEPLKWQDAQGDTWEFDPQALEAAHQLRTHLASQIQALTWKWAALHYCGEGIEKGADLTTPVRHVAWWNTHGLPGHARTFQTWAQGA
eukprot:9806542-Heterocapsa_arctica.AAC.1